jgi:hypothetical protein
VRTQIASQDALQLTLHPQHHPDLLLDSLQTYK